MGSGNESSTTITEMGDKVIADSAIVSTSMCFTSVAEQPAKKTVRTNSKLHILLISLAYGCRMGSRCQVPVHLRNIILPQKRHLIAYPARSSSIGQAITAREA